MPEISGNNFFVTYHVYLAEVVDFMKMAINLLSHFSLVVGTEQKNDKILIELHFNNILLYEK